MVNNLLLIKYFYDYILLLVCWAYIFLCVIKDNMGYFPQETERIAWKLIKGFAYYILQFHLETRTLFLKKEIIIIANLMENDKSNIKNSFNHIYKVLQWLTQKTCSCLNNKRCISMCNSRSIVYFITSSNCIFQWQNDDNDNNSGKWFKTNFQPK